MHSFYSEQGHYCRQAHVGIPDGLFEEEHGRDGFYGPVSHLYHKHPPTGWTSIEGPLKPRAFDTRKIKPSSSFLTSKTWLLNNGDVQIGIAKWSGSSPCDAYRNADGDEVWFIHEGQGQLQTDYGWLGFAAGSYVVIPKGVTTRWFPDNNITALLVESSGRVVQPERGLMGQHALYDPGVLELPVLRPQEVNPDKQVFTLQIQRQQQLTTVTYPFDPLDVAGWKGSLMPCVLNMKDIRPVHSHRAHLAPSVHTTWVTTGAILCTFLPRPLEQDPEAQRVPFYHRNIDYDEFIFYHDADFFSRDGIAPGMITWHPAGIHHGPHPNAMKASWQKAETQEKAVMIDSVKPLMPTDSATQIEWPAYHMSWQ